jgi:hypothetical protein
VNPTKKAAREMSSAVLRPFGLFVVPCRRLERLLPLVRRFVLERRPRYASDRAVIPKVLREHRTAIAGVFSRDRDLFQALPILAAQGCEVSQSIRTHDSFG